MKILGLKPKAFAYDVVFTIIEIVTMVLWLKYALEPKQHVIAVIILSVGLLIEHTISLLAGRYNTF